jgi:NAD(P)-dependent dehydrogenase (short-subunit alcohol dehydrogenase family)
MAVNYDGTFEVVRAFVPVLERNGGGAIVNVLSLLSLASTPPMTGYSASKAAAHSLTQALRPVLREKRISEHGVYPAGQEDIFPDPNAQAMARTWWSDPKALERAFSG